MIIFCNSFVTILLITDQLLREFYNRLPIQMDYEQELIAENAVYEKSANPLISGYFQDGFENPKDFPSLPEYHFRIEDPSQILELKRLYESSKPIETGFYLPGMVSEQFTNKVNSLLNSIDGINYSANPLIQEQIIEPDSQAHGFYSLKEDEYDGEKALEAAYQHLRLQSLSKKMSQLKISQVKFKPRQNKESKISQAEKEVTKKLRKMKISQDYQF